MSEQDKQIRKEYDHRYTENLIMETGHLTPELSGCETVRSNELLCTIFVTPRKWSDKNINLRGEQWETHGKYRSGSL